MFFGFGFERDFSKLVIVFLTQFGEIISEVMDVDNKGRTKLIFLYSFALFICLICVGRGSFPDPI